MRWDYTKTLCISAFVNICDCGKQRKLHKMADSNTAAGTACHVVQRECVSLFEANSCWLKSAGLKERFAACWSPPWLMAICVVNLTQAMENKKSGRSGMSSCRALLVVVVLGAQHLLCFAALFLWNSAGRLCVIHSWTVLKSCTCVPAIDRVCGAAGCSDQAYREDLQPWGWNPQLESRKEGEQQKKNSWVL